MWMEILQHQQIICSLFGALLVGVCGIFPLLVIPIEEGANLKHGAAARTLRILLSFAVGGLLGNVFFHLLPEAWATEQIAYLAKNPGETIQARTSMSTGMWVLAGILSFTVLEMALPDHDDSSDEQEHEKSHKLHQEKNCEERNGNYISSMAVLSEKHLTEVNKHKNNNKPPEKRVQVSGYLNLMANSIDNFMHGLAIGGGFLVSFKMGVLTTLAILVHEVPHEIGDFAILLRSGFTRWEAARAQVCTAGSGLLGALSANIFSMATFEEKTSWVVPFTAGGFLHIALVTVLPELIAERDKWESAKQIASLVSGVALIALLTQTFD
ncbi:zinc transporter ZIP13-like [Neocloeon triangulifer]|uniref:zinc transporter ZIP13-like n=1 Tax=Neocloeon triangulifer TaxID=2078957 RepID=UPI00286F293C|nr:zinc transporter ZIP13-like [Neocloeon triangulifer]